MAPQRTKCPRMLGVFVDQLQCLADVLIRDCTGPPTFAGTKGFDPTAQHLDKEDDGIFQGVQTTPQLLSRPLPGTRRHRATQLTSSVSGRVGGRSLSR